MAHRRCQNCLTLPRYLDAVVIVSYGGAIGVAMQSGEIGGGGGGPTRDRRQTLRRQAEIKGAEDHVCVHMTGYLAQCCLMRSYWG